LDDSLTQVYLEEHGVMLSIIADKAPLQLVSLCQVLPSLVILPTSQHDQYMHGPHHCWSEANMMHDTVHISNESLMYIKAFPQQLQSAIERSDVRWPMLVCVQLCCK